jgi:hypothetical protein
MTAADTRNGQSGQPTPSSAATTGATTMDDAIRSSVVEVKTCALVKTTSKNEKSGSSPLTLRHPG